MPDQAELLLSPADVERQFYRALSTGDINLLMACWSDDDEVACVPPGGVMVRGLSAIRELFADLFERGPVNLTAKDIHAVDSVMHAVHTLIEEIEVVADGQKAMAQVFATNVFLKTPRGWRLQVHHASPGQVISAAEPHVAGAERVLH